MQIVFTPQRSDRSVSYALDGSTLTITEGDATIDVDLDSLPDEHNYPITSITDDTVTVIQFYGDDERHIYEGNA